MPLKEKNQIRCVVCSEYLVENDIHTHLLTKEEIEKENYDKWKCYRSVSGNKYRDWGCAGIEDSDDYDYNDDIVSSNLKKNQELTSIKIQSFYRGYKSRSRDFNKSPTSITSVSKPTAFSTYVIPSKNRRKNSGSPPTVFNKGSGIASLFMNWWEKK